MSHPLVLTNAIRLPEPLPEPLPGTPAAPPPAAAPVGDLPPAALPTRKADLVFQPVEHLLQGLADPGTAPLAAPLPVPLPACA